MTVWYPRLARQAKGGCSSPEERRLRTYLYETARKEARSQKATPAAVGLRARPRRLEGGGPTTNATKGLDRKDYPAERLKPRPFFGVPTTKHGSSYNLRPKRSKAYLRSGGEEGQGGIPAAPAVGRGRQRTQ